MSSLQVNFTEPNSERLNALSKRTGKTPEELANEAVENFAAELGGDEQEKFLAWREAAERLAGIWKDRDDLPDFEELRKTWDRGYGPKE
jgi:predicted DNA-binding protein